MTQPTQSRKAPRRSTLQSLLYPFTRQRTSAVVHPFRAKPTPVEQRHNPEIHVFDYTADKLEEHKLLDITSTFPYRDSPTKTWLNLDGIDKAKVEAISHHYGIHPLLQEDILSYGQRPKMDEVGNILFVLLNMLYYNEQKQVIEQEQISIVLGENFVISFQQDTSRDVFNPIRERLKYPNTKLRQKSPDYLLYSLIDIIVDSYFHVIEKIGDRIEQAEEAILQNINRKAFDQINVLRKELILLKRNTTPVRDMVNGLLRSDSELLDDDTTKYYKDVYDHIMQANDLVDNYRDLLMGLQDMYFNNVNLRMNEVMKTLAIVTTVMAPATVIGGIFGMNFEVIPYSHHKWGFYGTVAIMIIIPLLMIWWFYQRGWFNTNSKQENQ